MGVPRVPKQMTEEEEKKLRELQAKKKAIQRAERQFEKDLDGWLQDHRDDVLTKLGIDPSMYSMWMAILDRYQGVNPEQLYLHIMSDKQVDYFYRNRTPDNPF